MLTTVEGAGAALSGMAAAPLLKRVSEPLLLAMALACMTLAMLALTIPQTASLAIGAALITVVDYRVLLVVIAVTAAASGLLVIGQPGIWRRLLPGSRRFRVSAWYRREEFACPSKPGS